MKIKFYIKTYGCKFNQVDSELIRKVLEKEGFELSPAEKAELIVVNTCGVVERTERKITKYSLELKKRGKKIIFAGCLPRISPEISEKFSDGMISPTNILDLPEIISKVLKGEKAKSLDPKPIDKAKIGAFYIPKNSVVSVVQISEGCLLKCSFCGTKLAKGNVRSFDKEYILENIKLSLRQGVKEIQLTSQDLAVYGGETGKLLLPELLSEISKIQDEFRVRLGMMSPGFTGRIIEKLLDTLQSEKFYKFFHLPVESGSNEILKLMGRNYQKEEFLSMIERINREFEFPLFATDIIVGFPGEGKEDFKETVSLIEKTQPEILHIFRYSKRKGTLAEKLKQIPERIKKERSRVLTKIWQKILKEKSKKYLRKKFEALITEKRGNTFLARLPSFKAVILEKGKLGEFVKVKITGAKPNYLIAKICKE
jgi:threonylcarbamoyladenosine tRNA methylthiotransferase CDKAL1